MPIPKTTGSRSFKIFIGGVAQGTTEDDLKNFFQTFGPVSARTPPPPLCCWPLVEMVGNHCFAYEVLPW